MRTRILLLVLACCTIAALVAPARAVLPLPILLCRWDGTLHVDNSSPGPLRVSVGPGGGRCSGDGGGPYDITFSSGAGRVKGMQGPFDLSVRYKLRSVQDGSARWFRQDWKGFLLPCVPSPFTVQKPLGLLVGVGHMNICSTTWSEPPPDPFDVPVFFSWRFVPSV